MIRFIQKIIRKLFRMIDPLEILIHDIVTSASAGSYNAEELNRLGLRLDMNTFGKRTRFVGDATNPIYPDIVIWKPENLLESILGTGKGTAVIVERIETKNSIDSSVGEWVQLASVGVTFNLVIPVNELAKVQQIVEERKLSGIIKLQTYRYDDTSKHYIFTDVVGAE